MKGTARVLGAGPFEPDSTGGGSGWMGGVGWGGGGGFHGVEGIVSYMIGVIGN